MTVANFIQVNKDLPIDGLKEIVKRFESTASNMIHLLECIHRTQYIDVVADGYLTESEADLIKEAIVYVLKNSPNLAASIELLHSSHIIELDKMTRHNRVYNDNSINRAIVQLAMNDAVEHADTIMRHSKTSIKEIIKKIFGKHKTFTQRLAEVNVKLETEAKEKPQDVTGHSLQ